MEECPSYYEKTGSKLFLEEGPWRMSNGVFPAVLGVGRVREGPSYPSRWQRDPWRPAMLWEGLEELLVGQTWSQALGSFPSPHKSQKFPTCAPQALGLGALKYPCRPAVILLQWRIARKTSSVREFNIWANLKQSYKISWANSSNITSLFCSLHSLICNSIQHIIKPVGPSCLQAISCILPPLFLLFIPFSLTEV